MTTAFNLPVNESFEEIVVGSWLQNLAGDRHYLARFNGNRPKPELWHVQKYRVTIEAILTIYDREEPVTQATLMRELEARKQLDLVGGPAGITALYLIGDIYNDDFYISELRKLADERKAKIELHEIDQRIGALNQATQRTPEENKEFGYLLRKRADLVEGDSPSSPQQKATSDFPPLPESVTIDYELASLAGEWVNTYTDYAAAVSPMTPRDFHTSAALALVSMGIARRLCLRMAHGIIFPNLFVVWIAASTLWAKTTGLNIARRLARRLLAPMLAPQESTPEALISDMAGQQPLNYSSMTPEQTARWQAARNFAAQPGLILDEFSALLNGSGKDYMAGTLESFLRFYDCDDDFTRSSQGRGRISIKDSYLTMLTASTPGALAMHLKSDRLWVNGFLPRCVLLSPAEDRPEWATSIETDEPAEIAAGLRRLLDRLPKPEWPNFPKPIDVRISPEAFDVWAAFDKTMRHDLLCDDQVDQRLWSLYGRLPTHALKVAIILAALDWPGDVASPVIELPQIMRALEIAETWRASAHKVVGLAAETEQRALTQRILRIVSLAGEHGASLRDISRAMRDQSTTLLEIELSQLVKVGELVNFPSKPGPRGGRPSKDRYMIARG